MEEIFRLYREIRGLFGENDLREELCQQIHRITQETIDRIPEGTRIAIRPAGQETRKMLGLFDFSRKNVIGIVDKDYRGDDYCGYPCYTANSFSTKLCDCVIIFSYRYRQKIKDELEACHIPYLDFYDELEKQGIQLLVPYFFYELCPQSVVNHYYLHYLRSEAGPQREAALNSLLQIAVEYKDFVLVSNIYQDCGGENGEFPLLKTIWRKSKCLLDRIQNKFLERKQKDIILFWTDAVPYNKLHYLSETIELSQQGTAFQRAYAPTAHTNATMRAMFRNMLPIDDFPQNQEKIDSQNSSLIRFMEKKGYRVREVGFTADKTSMGKEYLLETELYESCAMKWWKGIVDLLQSPEPCFYIFHFMESHPPYVTPDLKEPVNPDIVTEAQREVQIKAAYRYLDQCLLLYHELAGKKVQIFFSDHGRLSGWDTRWEEDRLHTYCFVIGENIPRVTVTRFFPYTNFERFVRWLVDPVRFPLDDACADEVIIQETDTYNPERIDDFIQKGHEKHGVAFRGILNYDYKYVINSLGDEFFYQMQQDGSEKLVALEDHALRAKLRDKAGTDFLDIYQYDKFRYARKLYDFLRLNEE